MKYTRRTLFMSDWLRSLLRSFGAFCKISYVNVSIIISTAVIKQIVKVHGPLVWKFPQSSLQYFILVICPFRRWRSRSFEILGVYMLNLSHLHIYTGRQHNLSTALFTPSEATPSSEGGFRRKRSYGKEGNRPTVAPWQLKGWDI